MGGWGESASPRFQRPNDWGSKTHPSRSPGSHSAILEFGPQGPTLLRIRCHLERRWTETFDLTPARQL